MEPYCIRVKKCSLNEVQAYLLYRYGLGMAKRKMTESTFYHCKKRAEEIAEEQNAGALLEVIQTETEVEMQPRNKAAMDEVEQQIIELQERVLDLHKQKRAMKISDAYYNAQVNDYSQQLGALESRKQALQTADARYATVRMWLADFRQHMQEGDATDDRDGSIMKTLVEAIIVWDDRIEVRFKCGATVEQKYVE